MGDESEWSLQSGHYLGEISALCFLHAPPHFSSLPYLLVGTGSQMQLYDVEAGKMMRSFHVFEGIRVHGICCCSIHSSSSSTKEPPLSSSSSSILDFQIAVFGERRVKLFSLKIQLVQNQSQVDVDLSLSCMLPKFSHWVLDVCFLQDNVISSHEGSYCLAVGCSDNTVCIWDIFSSSLILEVRSPERCLLYSMRLWGDELNTLHIASGTIYNEIIVWKVVPQNSAPSLTSLVKDQANQNSSFNNVIDIHGPRCEALLICRLSGHEGSIFRIAWSSNGSTLVSVSDDRCARIWKVHAKKKESNSTQELVGPVLFGHSARVWDCCIFDSLIVTAGEDCTCRVWGLNGDHLKLIKEHIGRGIWRCLCDPNTSLLITAGFDSSIKVRRLHASLTNSPDENPEEIKEFIDKPEVFTLRLPNSLEHIGLMDSKSEYVRCLHFKSEKTLYVATNNGYLYHAKVSDAGDVKWTELVWLSEEVPIVCMDLLSGYQSNPSSDIEDWVAVGDGKGGMTVVRVVDELYTPKVGLTIAWSAEAERQLLGTHWCKSLGKRYIFTTDPKGKLKLWSFCDFPQPLTQNFTRSCSISLVAEFISCLGIRIICLDASFEEEVLVCGDLRGNLVFFPLLKGLLLDTSLASEVKITPLTYFKGAHGISSVSSISLARYSYDRIEIHSTGGDGCICYLTYERDQKVLEFIGMKQVKELSLIQSVSTDANCINDRACGTGTYAIGFASSNFIIWNLLTETKVVQISCGGWRRPHSYYLGDVPEMKNCFAYVKDEIIYIHRHWAPESEGKKFHQNLRMQFHGREIHSICFIPEDLQYTGNMKNRVLPKSSEMTLIATGCEDGTVRLTRYTSGVGSWSASKLLGEHVGGSAVRSICSVSKIYKTATDGVDMPNGSKKTFTASEDRENPFLLISVGAKRVLTCWMMRKRMDNKDALSDGPQNETKNIFKHPAGMSSAMSFQWLSTDMPSKYSGSRKKTEKTESVIGVINDVAKMKLDATSGSLSSKNKEEDLKNFLADDNENDWRYLAVTAFLVTGANSRLTVCFIVVACSNATLTLRALVLPYRFWFDVALLIPVSSPVLALQHVVVHIPFEDEAEGKRVYIVIGGSTDGSIAFWDLTESVEAFMLWVSTLHLEKFIDCERRPRTGRGSQGGRWWKVLSKGASKKISGGGSVTAKAEDGINDHLLNFVTSGTSSNSTDSGDCETGCYNSSGTVALESEVHTDDTSFKICEIWALHVLKNIHQSGVNCLHISENKYSHGTLYNVISGGDDQALHCLRFDFALISRSPDFQNDAPYIENPFTDSHCMKNFIHNNQSQHYRIRFLCHDKIASAHSSAVKGVWTDGTWAFSTGLDQRVRCWHVEECGKLSEHSHLVISVPEPEALNARACGRNRYQIAVAGRGMQMVEFHTSCDMAGRD